MQHEREGSVLDAVDVLADEIASSAATVDATMHTLLSRIRRFDALKGWARQGAKTCAHWLSWRVGDGLNAAREKVRVARALGSLPRIDEALKASRASPSPRWRSAFSSTRRTRPARSSRRFAAGFGKSNAFARAESFLASGPRARTAADRNQILVHLSEDVTAETWRAVLADGSWIAGDTLLRLACDAGVVFAKTSRDGTVLDVGRRRRTVSRAQLHALQIRDGQCRFPGCTHRAFMEAHHVVHWAQGGETNLENLVFLCAAHHRAVHEEGFRIDRWTDGSLMFIDPSGYEIEDAPEPMPPSRAIPTFDPKTNFVVERPYDYADAVQGLVRKAGLENHGLSARPNERARIQALHSPA